MGLLLKNRRYPRGPELTNIRYTKIIMVRMYCFIFYITYKLMLRLSRKDIPEGKAIALLSLWDTFYLIIIYGILKMLLKNELAVPKITVFFLYIVIFIVHFVFLVSNRVYLRIYRDFEKKRSFTLKYGAITFITFYLAAIVFMIIIVEVISK